MKLLKDVIAVKPLEAPLQSNLLSIPKTADQNYLKGIKAEVLFIGTSFRHKNLVKKGDIVIVPNHLGNRHIINGESIRFYDGEDVLAIISEHHAT